MTDTEQVSQALAELWDIVKCRCNEAYTGRGLHDPDCQCDSTDAVKTVADRIEALLVGHELQEVIDKQAALLADAYGADLDWEEVLKQRADHEAVKRIEALTKERDQHWDSFVHWRKEADDRSEQLNAARQDAKEAEAYAEELEKELNTCRMAQAVMDNTVADLEAKLASGVIAEYDDDSTVFLSGYAGGAAIGGAWSTLTLMEKASDGTLRVREYKAQGDWRATLVEIKAT